MRKSKGTINCLISIMSAITRCLVMLLIYIFYRALKYEQESSSDSEDLEVMSVEDNSNKWDCESILSTYSTLYNHPRLIEEPQVCTKILSNHT